MVYMYITSLEPIREDWDEVKAGILEMGMKATFDQHPKLKAQPRAQLVATAGEQFNGQHCPR